MAQELRKGPLPGPACRCVTRPPSPPCPNCTGVYFVVCMALLVISLAETILIVRLVHKQDLQQPVPTWLRHLLLERVAPLLCLGEQSPAPRSPATSHATKTDDCSGERGRVPASFWPECRDRVACPWRRCHQGAWAGAWELGAVLHVIPTPGLTGWGRLQAKVSVFLHLHRFSSAWAWTERSRGPRG